MAEKEIRVVIVDDSALSRALIRDVLSTLPGCNVLGHAGDGDTALQRIAHHKPDLITLDVEMPNLSGIEVLRAIKREGYAAKAIMISRFTDRGTDATTEALMEGAFDFICKPSGGDLAANKATLRDELATKIAAFRDHRDATRNPSLAVPRRPLPQRTKERPAIVVLGASTGGPEALRSIFARMPPGFPVPIVVVQHIPATFTGALAARLDGISPLEVSEAKDGVPLQAGHVYLAAGGRHLKVSREAGRLLARITNDEPELSCRPAVDYTLRSAVKTCGRRVVAAIITGMGKDGLAGCTAVGEAGGFVIAQHPDDCAVYGMPRAVIEAGLADQVATIEELPDKLGEVVEINKPRR